MRQMIFTLSLTATAFAAVACGGGGDTGTDDKSPAYLAGMSQGKAMDESPVNMVPAPKDERDACEITWQYGWSDKNPASWREDFVDGCMAASTKYE